MMRSANFVSEREKNGSKLDCAFFSFHCKKVVYKKVGLWRAKEVKYLRKWRASIPIIRKVLVDLVTQIQEIVLSKMFYISPENLKYF